MHKRYISKLTALGNYILQFQNRTPKYKLKAVKSRNDFMGNIVNRSQQRYLDDNIIEDILFKYNNIKTEIEQDYPSIANELSKDITYEIAVYEIDYLLNRFKNMPELDIAIKKEGVFLNGQEFDAFLFIGVIISDAEKSIRLIDNFIDVDVLTTLSSNKSKEIKVKILTKNIADISKVAQKKFNRQYQNIEIKRSKNFHDRFVFIDEKYIYHLGCSIKDAGNKTFMFSRIKEPEIKDILNKKWSEEWAISKAINS